MSFRNSEKKVITKTVDVDRPRHTCDQPYEPADGPGRQGPEGYVVGVIDGARTASGQKHIIWSISKDSADVGDRIRGLYLKYCPWCGRRLPRTVEELSAAIAG